MKQINPSHNQTRATVSNDVWTETEIRGDGSVNGFICNPGHNNQNQHIQSSDQILDFYQVLYNKLQALSCQTGPSFSTKCTTGTLADTTHMYYRVLFQ